LTIGAGLSGIQLAYQIQKHCENVEHVIYEKNEDIGGTWLENRYPGCACDIPSHAYTLNFALNPDWPRFFSYAPDIQKYLLKVVEVFDLRKYMTFNTEVVRSEWQDDKGKWKVSLRQKSPSGETKDWDEECDLMLYATGILNNYKWPQIKGMETFKGRIVHTAIWPKEYQEEEWKNDRVAVIGSGASSIQTVPKMQPHAKHLDIFVRTGVWFVQIANNYGQNKEYSQEERDEFRKDPKKLVAHAKDIENQVNGLWGAFYTDSEAQKAAQQLFRERMKEFIKDERLLKGFTPKFEVGCKSHDEPHTLTNLTENRPPHHSWRSLHGGHTERQRRRALHSSRRDHRGWRHRQ
jgi:cation diffusion facilitator CzcD-associated flavoprotein CzcO